MFPSRFLNDRDSPPKLKLVIIGGPSSGKTTLLTLLSRNADRQRLPEDAAELFDQCFHGLREGHPIEASARSQELPKEILFDIAWQGKRLEVTTFDYAGESASDWLHQEDAALNERLSTADAVVFLVDSYDLCRAGKWETWAHEQGVESLFRWIHSVLSDRHHGNLPFAVVCSRSDLSDESKCEHMRSEIAESCRSIGLVTEVVSVSAFGEHAAEMPFPEPDGQAPTTDFLVPRDEISGCPESFLRLLFDLHKQNASRRKSSPIRRSAFVVVSLLAVTLLLAVVWQRVTKFDVGEQIKRMGRLEDAGDVKAVAELFPAVDQRKTSLLIGDVYAHYEECVDADDKEGREGWQRAYRDALERSLDSQLPRLRFSFDKGEWQDEQTWEFVRLARKELEQIQRTSALESIQARLREVLGDVNYPAGTPRQLAALAEAYSTAGLDVPSQLGRLLQEQEVAQLKRQLRTAVRSGNPDDLYSSRIPALTRSTNLKALDKGTRDQIDELKTYCILVSRTTEFRFDIKEYRRTGDVADDLEIQVELLYNAGRERTLYDEFYPANGPTSEFEGDHVFGQRGKGEDMRMVRLPFELRREPITITINDFDGKNGVVVRWRSDALSGSLVKNGYDLPGLGRYMVFKDCMEYRCGQNGGLGRDYRGIESKLVLRVDEDCRGLLSPPALLLEANRPQEE